MYYSTSQTKHDWEDFHVSYAACSKILGTDEIPKSFTFDPVAYKIFLGWDLQQFQCRAAMREFEDVEWDVEHFLLPHIEHFRPALPADLDVIDMLDEKKVSAHSELRKTLIWSHASEIYVAVSKETRTAFLHLLRVNENFQKVKLYFIEKRHVPLSSYALSIQEYVYMIFASCYRISYIQQVQACLLSCPVQCIDYDEGTGLNKYYFFPVLCYELLRTLFYDVTEDTDSGMIFTLKYPYFRTSVIRIKTLTHSPLREIKMQGRVLELEPLTGLKSAPRFHVISRRHMRIWKGFLSRIYVTELVDILFEEAQKKQQLFDFALNCQTLLSRKRKLQEIE